MASVSQTSNVIDAILEVVNAKFPEFEWFRQNWEALGLSRPEFQKLYLNVRNKQSNVEIALYNLQDAHETIRKLHEKHAPPAKK